jgi:hypothetical protein
MRPGLKPRTTDVTHSATMIFRSTVLVTMSA